METKDKPLADSKNRNLTKNRNVKLQREKKRIGGITLQFKFKQKINAPRKLENNQ